MPRSPSAVPCRPPPPPSAARQPRHHCRLRRHHHAHRQHLQPAPLLAIQRRPGLAGNMRASTRSRSTSATLPAATARPEPDRHQHVEPELYLPQWLQRSARGQRWPSGPMCRSDPAGQTLTDNGTLSFATGDTVTFSGQLRPDRRRRHPDGHRHHLQRPPATRTSPSTPAASSAPSGSTFNLPLFVHTTTSQPSPATRASSRSRSTRPPFPADSTLDLNCTRHQHVELQL